MSNQPQGMDIPIIDAARLQAQQIINDAKDQADQTRQEADAYVLETMRRLKAELEKTLQYVTAGITTLENKQA